MAEIPKMSKSGNQRSHPLLEMDLKGQKINLLLSKTIRIKTRSKLKSSQDCIINTSSNGTNKLKTTLKCLKQNT